MVEQRTENPCVVSPILTPGTFKTIAKYHLGLYLVNNYDNIGAWPSWLGRVLWEHEIVGSSPTAPTFNQKNYR